jgi:GntR family transcriptional regulator, rspAB operon transcriptional repressor
MPKKMNYDARQLPRNVYQTMRRDILSLKLKPGTSLLERSLAESLGVSRTPVREALHRLEAEGLTRRYPGIGMVVAELTMRDVVEAFQIREFIEPPAAAVAARVLRSEELAELLQMFKQLEASDLDVAEKHTRHDRLDAKIHDMIIEATGNRRLIEIMDNLRGLCSRARSLGTPIRFQESTREHQNLIRALMDGNGEQAEKIMRQHLVEARKRLVQII